MLRKPKWRSLVSLITTRTFTENINLKNYYRNGVSYGPTTLKITTKIPYYLIQKAGNIALDVFISYHLRSRAPLLATITASATVYKAFYTDSPPLFVISSIKETIIPNQENR